MAQNRHRGFTIVELMVVIVVIAILAAITVVSYGGVRDKAEKSAMIDTANAYVKAIEMYKVKNRKYPPYDLRCLGSVDQYPDIPGALPSGSCFYVQGGGGIQVDDQLMDDLRAVGLKGATKMKYTEFASYSGVLYMRGAMYQGDADYGRYAYLTYNSSPTRPENCGQGEVDSATDGGGQTYYFCKIEFN